MLLQMVGMEHHTAKSWSINNLFRNENYFLYHFFFAPVVAISFNAESTQITMYFVWTELRSETKNVASMA